MPEFAGLGREVFLVVRVVVDLQRHTGRYIDTHVAQRLDLARVVSHQLELADTQVIEHRQADGVVTLIRAKAQALIGFYGIRAAILQLIGADLVQQADTTAFLTQVEQDTAAFMGNRTQRRFELETAVATQTEQRIARQAFGVQTAQYGRAIGHITKGQGYMFLACGLFEEAMHGEHAKRRRQLGGGDKHDGHRMLLKKMGRNNQAGIVTAGPGSRLA